MTANLEFDRPIEELEARIAELKVFAREKELDLGPEIAGLESRARALKEQVYGHLTPWQKVQLARHPERPNAYEYITQLCSTFLPLHGDRLSGDDPALVGGIARFNGRAVTVLGHLKGRDARENVRQNFGMAHPEGYRKALRLMRQAEKFHRPVICFIDTPGAYCGMGAEERGQAEAIARNLAALATLQVPVVAVGTGEGGSGGALALAAGDRLLIQEYALFAVISPEAYASILWKDVSRAPEAAAKMKITAPDLLVLGVVDEVIPEPLGGAHRDRALAVRLVGEALARHLDQLGQMPGAALLAARQKRFRQAGHAYLIPPGTT